jgi:hypothetical protein
LQLAQLCYCSRRSFKLRRQLLPLRFNRLQLGLRFRSVDLAALSRLTFLAQPSTIALQLRLEFTSVAFASAKHQEGSSE